MKSVRLRGVVVAALLFGFSGCNPEAEVPDSGSGGGTAATGGGTAIDDAGVPDSGTPDECESLEDGTACGDSSAGYCDAPDTCLAGKCVPNHAAVGTSCNETSPDVCNIFACNAVGMCAISPAADGIACGDQNFNECFFSNVCSNGRCIARFADAGFPCGDASESECTNSDTCDGQGTCQPNHLADGTSCGDATDTECNAADTCIAGSCETHIADAGIACGDSTVNDCTVADTCDGLGACLRNDAVDGTACGDATNTDCNAADTCLTGVCAANIAMLGAPCGDSTDVECNAADTCDGTGSCLANVEPDGLVCSDCEAGVGQCATCGSGTCADSTCSTNVSTTLAATDMAGNNQRGNMFNVVATNSIVVSRIWASPMGNTTIEVYTTSGGYQGKGNTPGAWKKIATVPVSYGGGHVELPYSFNIPLSAGSTTGFYVTSNTVNVSLNYSNGNTEGATHVSDANISITEGVGLDYPFTNNTGAFYSPRIWNGRIGYVVPSELGAQSTGDESVAGLTFDLHAISTTRVSGLNVRTNSGTHDFSVYFRTESAAGFENDSTAWRLVKTYSGVTGGPNVHLSFPASISIPTGKTFGFYVTSPTVGGALLGSPGTAGAVAVSDSTIEMRVGNAVNGTFGGVSGPLLFDGKVQKLQCLPPLQP